MAVSSTTFQERLTRLDPGKTKLYVGDEAPQAFTPENLLQAKKKAKSIYWTAVVIGVLMGAFVGHMFKTNVGIEMFFSQSLPVLFSIIKADHTTSAICLGMIAGPVGAIGFLIFSRTKKRIAQFWWSYLAGAVGANASAWYYFYVAMSGA